MSDRVLHQAGAAEPDNPLASDFAKAAAELKERLEEQSMTVEDKVAKSVPPPIPDILQDLEYVRSRGRPSGSVKM